MNTTVPCTVGVFAHNEEANIGQLLEIMLQQELEQVEIREIIVVSSGSTDQTDEIVQEYGRRDERIRLLVQAERQGKASAINLFLKHQTERVLVICSADLQPRQDAIEKLVAPFADPEMGMTSSRPVPVNDPDEFMGFAAHLLWDLHHEINMSGGFKAGEMIAFIKIFERIPYQTSVDEASIEPVIRGQGYKVQYVPDAIVYHRVQKSRLNRRFFMNRYYWNGITNAIMTLELRKIGINTLPFWSYQMHLARNLLYGLFKKRSLFLTILACFEYAGFFRAWFSKILTVPRV